MALNKTKTVYNKENLQQNRTNDYYLFLIQVRFYVNGTATILYSKVSFAYHFL